MTFTVKKPYSQDVDSVSVVKVNIDSQQILYQIFYPNQSDSMESQAMSLCNLFLSHHGIVPNYHIEHGKYKTNLNHKEHLTCCKEKPISDTFPAIQDAILKHHKVI